MTPSDLGLPAKFTEFREPQLRQLEKAFSVDVRFNCFNLPTGFGKTLWYIAYSRLLSEHLNRPIRTVVLTATKALQTQILSDFSSAGLVDVRGRNNYACPMYGNCDKGHEHECHLATTHGCGYAKHLDIATQSTLISTNYAYWLSARMNNPQALESRDGESPIDLLVCDEAHQAFEELVRHMAIHIPYEWCVGFEKIAGTEGDTRKAFETECIICWAGGANNRIRSKQKAYEVSDDYKKHPEWVELERVRKQFVRLAKVDQNWVYRLHDRSPGSNQPSGLDFNCIWPAPYAGYLWSKVPKILLVSGTLTPYTTRILGVPSANSIYSYEKSTFPVNRYPIIHVPTAKLNYQSSDEDYRRVTARVDEIIGARLDRKGIIHSVSYDRASTILSNSKYSGLMITNANSSSSVAAVEKFKSASPPFILVSPSISTGWDFPNDDAEYIIILKVPYPNRNDVLVKARHDDDKQWYTHATVQTLVQMVGRGMRHHSDRCEVFILDNNIQLLKIIGKAFAPPGFFDNPRFRVSKDVPKPPPKLNALEEDPLACIA